MDCSNHPKKIIQLKQQEVFAVALLAVRKNTAEMPRVTVENHVIVVCSLDEILDVE